MSIHTKVSAIILAAGDSTRFGSIKQLLPYKQKPLLLNVIDVVKQYPFDQIIVVLGANSQEILDVILPVEGVTLIDNKQWSDGQSTSIRAGINALKGGTNIALFFLADQPNISFDLIHEVVNNAEMSNAAIVIPIINGHRSNPVAFKAVCFKELCLLQGDSGGKTLFQSHKIKEIIWETKNNEDLDVDNPDDYKRLLNE